MRLISCILLLVLLSVPAAAIEFSYSNVHVSEPQFNHFVLTFNSPDGYTCYQMNTFIKNNPELSPNIKFKSCSQAGTLYTVTGSLLNYSIKKNKVFNPWFNTSWGFKQAILINNTGGGALTNYQVPLFIPWDSEMNDDFSDIRIVNETTGTTIPYWIERKDDVVSADIWFNASNIPAAGWLNTTYYLYYGNAAASSESNGSTVFPFFDDFGGDLSKWTVTGTNTVISAGELRIIGANSWGTNGAVSTTSITKPFILEYIHRAEATGIYSAVGLTAGTLITVSDVGSLVDYFGGGTTYYIFRDSNGEYSGTYAATTNYNVKIINRDDGYDAYRDSILLVSGAAVTYNYIEVHQYGAANYAYIDNIRARKYVSLEPNTELGSQETPPPPPVTYTLSGYVLNYLNTSIPNTRLDLNNTYVVSNSSGYYLTELGAAGDYSILVRSVGYQNYTTTQNISTNTSLNFMLVEKTWVTESEAESVSINYSILGGLLGGVLVMSMIRRYILRNRR